MYEIVCKSKITEGMKKSDLNSKIYGEKYCFGGVIIP